MATDYDSPWKEALAVYFQAFMEFFFPWAAREIDWSRGYEILDKELRQVLREAEQGPRRVDLLVKVWLKNGQEEWILIHVEVQSQYDVEFPQRMYVYNNRLFGLYNRIVMSLAILGDDRPGWRPSHFGYDQWGCSLNFRFPVVKLLDYRDHVAWLEQDRNPFAVLVLAHLKTLETRGDAVQRRSWKFQLIRGLYERGFTQEQVRQLFHLIDWMMNLPADQEQLFWQEFQQYEQEKHMPYINSVERIGMRKGMLKTIQATLEFKFGQEGLQLMPTLSQLNDLDKLLAIHSAVLAATSVEEIRALVPSDQSQ